MINDISRAFFHATAKREVYVQLPSEDIGPSDQPLCGKLNYSMYGTRDAAQNWHEEYTFSTTLRDRIKKSVIFNVFYGSITFL